MSNHAFWTADHNIDDLVPNFVDDFDALLASEPPVSDADEPTRPVVVTARDLWPDNVTDLREYEAWSPGVDGSGDE